MFQGLRDQGFVRRDEHDPFGEKKIPCDVRLKDYSWKLNKVKKTEGTFGNHETGHEEVLLLLLLPPPPTPIHSTPTSRRLTWRSRRGGVC
jgi:hypothetical protein